MAKAGYRAIQARKEVADELQLRLAELPRSTFNRWASALGLSQPYSQADIELLSDLGRRVKGGSTLAEAAEPLKQRNNNNGLTMANETRNNTAPASDGGALSSGSVGQVVAHNVGAQAKQAMREIDTVTSQRDELVQAVATRVRHLMDPNSFFEDIATAVARQEEQASRPAPAGIFQGGTVDLGISSLEITQCLDERVGALPSVSDFLALKSADPEPPTSAPTLGAATNQEYEDDADD